jgi:DNA-binding NarL/FixJ family response regulator
VQSAGREPTARERLQGIAAGSRGWSNERIAREMHLSRRSVSDVLTSIYQRLDMPASPAARLRWWRGAMNTAIETSASMHPISLLPSMRN